MRVIYGDGRPTNSESLPRKRVAMGDVMSWRILQDQTAVNDDGIRIRRIGRDVLRYDAGGRYIDFTFEFGHTGASVYTKDIRTWQPNGEPFTAEEREIVEQHMRDVLHLHGYADVDFGLP